MSINFIFFSNKGKYIIGLILLSVVISCSDSEKQVNQQDPAQEETINEGVKIDSIRNDSLKLKMPKSENSESPLKPFSRKREFVTYTKKDSAFIDYVKRKVLKRKKDKNNIVNLNELLNVKVKSIDSKHIHYLDTVLGKEISLLLKYKLFDSKAHKIKYTYSEDSTFVDYETIDGVFPWGGYYGGPDSEVEKANLIFGKREISLKKEMQDLFNVDFGKAVWKNFSPAPTLYISKDATKLFLYIQGGNAAGTFFTKFTISENGSKRRTLLHKRHLGETGSYTPDFKGF